MILEKVYTCHQTEVQAPLSEDTFDKEIGTALKKTCDHGNSFGQFDLNDLDMTLKLLLDKTQVKYNPTPCQTS